MTDQVIDITEAIRARRAGAIDEQDLTAARPHPEWCGQERCEGDHHDDAFRGEHGVSHRSSPVDVWTPTEDGAEKITVFVSGFRYDNGEDGPNFIEAENTHPGFVSEVRLEVPDARRLGLALLKACDLAEQDPARDTAGVTR